MLKLVAALLAVPMTFLAAIAATGILVVDVRPSDGPHLMIPVPLVLVQAAVSLAPRGAARVEIPEIGDSLPAAERLVQALADAPDGELVRVEEPREQVSIRKVGSTLEVRVHGERGEDVSVNLPLAMAKDVLARAHGRHLAAADMVGLLHQARFTTLVDVHDHGDHVKVTVW